MEGIVAWFNNAKGFGFIKRGDGGEDVFVHYTAIDQPGYRSLKENDRVTFGTEIGEKGKPQAVAVKVVK
jgi:cold shock protein